MTQIQKQVLDWVTIFKDSSKIFLTASEAQTVLKAQSGDKILIPRTQQEIDKNMTFKTMLVKEYYSQYPNSIPDTIKGFDDKYLTPQKSNYKSEKYFKNSIETFKKNNSAGLLKHAQNRLAKLLSKNPDTKRKCGCGKPLLAHLDFCSGDCSRKYKLLKLQAN